MLKSSIPLWVLHFANWVVRSLAMTSRFQNLPFLLALLFASPAIHSQTAAAPLTLQGAIALARAQNPTLLSGQEHITATRASEITAGLRQNPTFTFSGADVSLPADNPASPYSYT